MPSATNVLLRIYRCPLGELRFLWEVTGACLRTFVVYSAHTGAEGLPLETHSGVLMRVSSGFRFTAVRHGRPSERFSRRLRRGVALGAAGLLVSALTGTPVLASTSGAAASRPVVNLDSPAVKQPTPTLPAAKGFSADSSQKAPRPVAEIVSSRTATSTTWKNDDGSITVKSFVTPQFYKPSPTADWAPIDSSLGVAPDQPDRVQSGANTWKVSLGAAGDPNGFEQITLPDGRISFIPEGISDPKLVPAVSGSTATYAGAWPNVDIVEHVAADTVAEDLVLKGPGAPSSYVFSLSGATAVANKTGGLDVVIGGETVGVIPALTVSPAKQEQKGATPKSVVRDSGAKLSAASGKIVVSISPTWLASLPKAAFPLVIDPSFSTNPTADQAIAFSDQGNTSSTVAQVGQDSSGANWVGAAHVSVPSPPSVPSGQQPWQPTSASFLATCNRRRCVR